MSSKRNRSRKTATKLTTNKISKPANTNGVPSDFAGKFMHECMGALSELSSPNLTEVRAGVCVEIALSLGVDRWDMLSLLADIARYGASDQETTWTVEQINWLTDVVKRLRANPQHAEDDYLLHWATEGARAQDGIIRATGRLAYAATFQARSEGKNPAWDGSGIVEEMIDSARFLASGAYGNSDGEEIVQRIVAGIMSLGGRHAA